ncbi:MAG: ECF transporter S component [Candidatus Hermodarchaeota archaeon]
MNETLQEISVKNDDSGEDEGERETHSVWLERKSFRLTLISIFSALTVILGYLLIDLTNIELVTLTIFLSGFIMGKRDGMIVGFLSSSIFCFFNPYGSYLPLYAFQLLHYTLTGLLGALTKQFLRDRKVLREKGEFYTVSMMIFFGSLGFIITTSFQVFASLVDVLTQFGTIKAFLPYFFNPAAIPFTIIHIVGNTLGFIFILPGLIQLVQKMIY